MNSISSPSEPLTEPLHAVKAEQAVLGGLLLDRRAWDEIADSLREQDFSVNAHRLIFRAMTDLMVQCVPLDVVTVSEQLDRLQCSEAVGGLAYVGELAKNTASAFNIKAHADIVREKSVLRQLARTGTEIAEMAFSPGSKAAQELLDEAEQKVFAIARQSEQKQGPQLISEVLASAVDRIDLLFRTGAPIIGLPTGFSDFDKLTSGLQKGDFIVIAGRPSMGKTTFAINLAENAVMRNDGAVLIFSMEMAADTLASRILASLGRIEQQRIRNGQLNDEEWQRITAAITLIAGKKLLIDDGSVLTPLELRARARRAVREYGPLSMIVVDYLQLMRVSGFQGQRASEISEISRSLKALARELDVPVVVLSQLNRGLEQRPDKRPLMSDLRESGAIEQDADLIVFIFREEVYRKDIPEKGVAEIIIGKQRNGPIGTVRLTFLGQYSRFENYTGNQDLPYGAVHA